MITVQLFFYSSSSSAAPLPPSLHGVGCVTWWSITHQSLFFPGCPRFHPVYFNEL
jgi:hypothetical protein